MTCVALAVSTDGCRRSGSAGNAILDSIPDPVSFEPLAPETWQLHNGLKVLFIEDREVPLVRGTLYLRGGSLWEKQPGVVDAMGAQLRQGGAGDLSADQIDRELEKSAAGIGSDFSAENGTISFSCLSADLERIFKIFSDVVLKPRFEESRLLLWKGQTIEAIKRRRDDPEPRGRRRTR